MSTLSFLVLVMKVGYHPLKHGASEFTFLFLYHDLYVLHGNKPAIILHIVEFDHL